MKKFITLCLVLLLLVPASVVSAASLKPDPNIDVLLEGEKLFFEVDPIQTEGTTFVQFTTIFKALGLNYEWIPASKEVHAYNENLDLWLALNSRDAVLNGELVELAVAPFAYEGRTLVPLRFVSQSTGMQVDWDGANKLIEIYSKNSTATPSAKSIVDFVDYAKGANQEVVQKFMPDFPAEVSEFYIQYDKVDFLGYNTELNYSFIDDELTGAIYYYGRYGEKDSIILDVYEDIVGNLQLYFGYPKTHEVMTAWEEGAGQEVVGWHLSDSELLKGLKNGSYEITTEWKAKDGTVQVFLYLTDNNVLNIETSFIYN